MESGSCPLPAHYISKMRRMVLSGLKPFMPIAIITYGPTGSGKSRVVPSVLASPEFKTINNGNTHLTPNDFAPILVDNFVEAIPYYTNYNPPSTLSTEEQDKALVNQYFACRVEINDLSTSLFESAIQFRYNIVYETTGNTINKLLGDVEKLRHNGYMILLAFPILPLDVLERRVTQRNAIQKRKVQLDYVQRNYKNALNNFKSVIPFVHYSFVLDNTVPFNVNMPVLIFVDNFVTGTHTRPTIQCRAYETVIENWDEQARIFFDNLCMQETQCVLRAVTYNPIVRRLPDDQNETIPLPSFSLPTPQPPQWYPQPSLGNLQGNPLGSATVPLTRAI
jgi:predicted ABC-type ATPase